MEVIPVDARDAGAIERGVAVFAHSLNGGLIVTSTRFAVIHRDQVRDAEALDPVGMIGTIVARQIDGQLLHRHCRNLPALLFRTIVVWNPWPVRSR